MLIPASAGADELPVGDGLPSTLRMGGAIPDSILEQFADCPTHEEMAGSWYIYCVSIRAYDGVLKLGSVEATIDEPLEILAGIGQDSEGAMVIVLAGDDGSDGDTGGFEPVKISGGILGIPELDPLIDAEPLGLLSLAAAPVIGDLGASVEALQPTHLKEISLPLSIQLNNTLFGEDCWLGTADNPIDINLTTGTTTPPRGNPMSGTPPVQSAEYQFFNYLVPPGVGVAGYRTGIGARSVDNDFDVPGVDCPGIGGVGDTVGDLLADFGLGDGVLGTGWFANPVEWLVNNQVGLPSPAGRNHVAISVDTAWVTAAAVGIINDGLVPTAEIGDTGFGAVEVGTTATKTVSISNPTTEPLVLGAGTHIIADPGEFGVVSDGCASATLAPGESCDMELSFTPSAAGIRSGGFWHQDGSGAWFPEFHLVGGPQATLYGTGVDPDAELPAEDPVDPVDEPGDTTPAPPKQNCLLGLGLNLKLICL